MSNCNRIRYKHDLNNFALASMLIAYCARFSCSQSVL